MLSWKTVGNGASVGCLMAMTRDTVVFLLVFTLLFPLLVLVSSAGCGPSRQDVATLVAAVNNVNGKRLANLYAIHQSRHEGAGPKDRKAFEQFIRNSLQPAELVGTGVDQSDIASLFVSERDKRPFFIRYGVSSPDPSSPGVNIAVVFEEEGINDTVEVFMTGPKVERVPLAAVTEWKAGKHDRLQDAAPGR